MEGVYGEILYVYAFLGGLTSTVSRGAFHLSIPLEGCETWNLNMLGFLFLADPCLPIHYSHLLMAAEPPANDLRMVGKDRHQRLKSLKFVAFLGGGVLGFLQYAPRKHQPPN